MGYLEAFLASQGLPTAVARVGPQELRAFILYLQQKRCFSDHRLTRPQERGLSGHSINCYLRSIRSFFSWLVSEEVLADNPFRRVRVPRAPHRLVPTLSDPQLGALLDAIDTSTPEGYRNYAVILTLLDTGLRVSELAGLRPEELWLEEGLLKVMGKGGKERLIPIGKRVQRLLWGYLNRFRPDPVAPRGATVFLTGGGRPLSPRHIQAMMARYGRRAGIQGVRCSPHTLRHCAAVRFLRNGGDAFSLQRLLGHSSLEMTRHYCQLADVDVKEAHRRASPVDNLELGAVTASRGSRKPW